MATYTDINASNIFLQASEKSGLVTTSRTIFLYVFTLSPKISLVILPTIWHKILYFNLENLVLDQLVVP